MFLFKICFKTNKSRLQVSSAARYKQGMFQNATFPKHLKVNKPSHARTQAQDIKQMSTQMFGLLPTAVLTE
jgi:hypothetical protein